jgi:DNA sulfur modification protein DndC
MLEAQIDAVVRSIGERYCGNDIPWYVGYSGGKDSTALVAAVYEAVARIGGGRKPITLLYCDTGVEIPVVARHAKRTLVQVRRQARRDGFPIAARVVKPRLADRFFVKVIGRGYAPPTNRFRWCTDRLRVGPVRRAMDVVGGRSLVLLGTRWSESEERNRTLARFRLGDRYSFRQSGSSRSMIYAPLADFSTQEVWKYLDSRQIPAFLDIDNMRRLYRSASGSNCAGACHACTTNRCGRFGCWTCTVVRKDKAMTNMVADGYHMLRPLLAFRNWLAAIQDDPSLRMTERRNGGSGPGPFTMRARKTILSRLLGTNRKSPWPLITEAEVRAVKRAWEDE